MKLNEAEKKLQAENTSTKSTQSKEKAEEEYKKKYA